VQENRNGKDAKRAAMHFGSWVFTADSALTRNPRAAVRGDANSQAKEPGA